MQSFWFEIIVGGWVLISPWVLGISSNALGKWSNVIIGMLFVLRALWRRYGVITNNANEDNK